MSSTSTKNPDTFDALAKTLTGVLAGIKANLAANKSLTMGGESVTVTQVTSDFQGYIDTNTAVDKAKQDTLTQVKQRSVLKTSIKKELATFTQWVAMTYGDAGYSMFGLTPPKTRTVSPTKKAIAIQKLKATAQAKAAAKAAAAPKQETLVAFDADGAPIGATPSSALIQATNVAPTTPPTGAGSGAPAATK